MIMLWCDSAPNFSFAHEYIYHSRVRIIYREETGFYSSSCCLLIHLFRTWWITRSTGSQSSLHMDTYCCALVLPRSHVDTGKSHDADLFLISNEINTQIFTMTILFIPWNHWNLIHRYQRVTPYRIYHCILFNIRNFVENNHHYNDNKSFSVMFDTLWILLKVALPGIVQCRDRWIRWK